MHFICNPYLYPNWPSLPNGPTTFYAALAWHMLLPNSKIIHQTGIQYLVLRVHPDKWLAWHITNTALPGYLISVSACIPATTQAPAGTGHTKGCVNQPPGS